MAPTSPKTQKLTNKLILRFCEEEKNTPHVVFNEEPKTGLGFEIGQRQRTFWHKPKVNSLANPAVVFYTKFSVVYTH